MVTVAQFRTRLDTALFNKYGKTVTHKAAGTHTYNNRGDITAASFTSSSITVVPYDINEHSKQYEAFSDFNPGDSAMVVRYSVTVSVGDQIVMEGITYEVKEVVKHYLPDNPVTIVRLAKIVS